MARPSGLLRIVALFLVVMLRAVAWPGCASAENTANPFLTEDSLNKMLGALSDLRSRNVPVQVGAGSVDSEIAKLKKQPNVEKIIKKRGLSLQEFVLTFKATAQIHEVEKSRDNWQKILMDPAATPQAKLEATQKLGDSMKAKCSLRSKLNWSASGCRTWKLPSPYPNKTEHKPQVLRPLD